MEISDILAIGAVVVSLFVGIYTARSTARVQAQATIASHDVASSQLAVRIANRADRKANHAERRLDSYDRWRRELVDEWWPHHRAHFDQVIVDDIRRLDPNAVIPDVRPMPRYVPPVADPPTEEDEETP